MHTFYAVTVPQKVIVAVGHYKGYIRFSPSLSLSLALISHTRLMSDFTDFFEVA